VEGVNRPGWQSGGGRQKCGYAMGGRHLKSMSTARALWHQLLGQPFSSRFNTMHFKITTQ